MNSLKKLLIFFIPMSIVGITCVGFIDWIGSSFAIGGGSHSLEAPDTVKTDESTDIYLIVSTTGDVDPIEGRFTDVFFHYKLVGENNFKVLRPQPIILPDNYKTVQSEAFQSEAYRFTIPPYPKGTTGQIEHYLEMTFDGRSSKTNGNTFIQISDDAKSPYDLKNNLSVFKVCDKNFIIDIITLQKIKVTERIATLMGEESSRSRTKDNTTFCYALQKMPEYSVLNSTIKDYDSKNLKYFVTLQFPFVIDLKENLVYEFNEADQNNGAVFGKLW